MASHSSDLLCCLCVSVRPTTRPVFSANTVRPSKRPLDGMDRPPTVRVVQWSTASEYGGIEQCPTVNTRPDKAASIRCSCNDTPPSVNSNPFFMSKVCGSTEPKVSVPIIASVLKSHKNGELRLEPQERHHTRRTSQDVNRRAVGAPQLPRSSLQGTHRCSSPHQSLIKGAG